MRVVCIYKEGEGYSRTVNTWLEDFYRRSGTRIETMNPDENPGFMEAYDIVEYPTVMALGGSGEVVSFWRGLPLPLFDEIMYYMNG